MDAELVERFKTKRPDTIVNSTKIFFGTNIRRKIYEL